MSVVTSCRSRFHIFDQARELERNGALLKIITDYPKSYPARFGIPPEKVMPLLFSGIFYHGTSRAINLLSTKHQSLFRKWMHNNFSKKLASLIPDNTKFFIGLSSLCLEALEACKSKSILCAVDHGSLHLREALDFVNQEAERWRLPKSSLDSQRWVIEKEDKEFCIAETVLVLSSVARDSLVRNGVPIQKVFINPCGVNLSQFFEGYKKDKIFRVIQVGAISLGKGVLTLLDAYAQAGLKDSELHFVGAGLESSGLKGIINAMKIQNVHFHNSVNQSKLREFYIQSSVFVLASVADGFGMVVLQAMACGLPVIVTENVGAKDLIQDGVNGFVVPVGAPEIIALRLRELHDNPELCKKMGVAAKLTVKNGFTWANYGDRLADYIQMKLEK